MKTRGKLIRNLFGATLAIGLSVLVFATPEVLAQQSSSTQYQVNEAFFGTGGVDTCPTVGANTYCSKQSAGELTVGNTKGALYQAYGGFNTDRTESLEVVVTKASADLGILSTGAAKMDYSTFTVKSYLASGYVVQTVGVAPTYGSHTLTPLATPTASVTNTEQFGMNLRANTAPLSVGSNPAQDGSFGFGTAAAGYNTANQYKYVAGDTIAQSTESSGITTYTISYMANISGTTPAGVYVMQQSIVVTSTF